MSSAKMDANGLAYLDATEGMGRIGNNKALFSRLLDTFVKDANWDKLCEFYAADNLADAAAAAHAIKGMSANLSMKALAATSMELEAALKAGTKDDALLEAVRVSRDGTLEAITAFKEQA